MRTKHFFLFAVASLMAFSACKEKEEDVIKSSEKQIIEFVINSTKGNIDESAKTVSFDFPFGTEVTALAPTINISAKATISPASKEVKGFTNPVVYTVTAEDGAKQVYAVTVNVGLEQSNSSNILSFAINSVNATIDQVAKTITLTLPYGTDIENLTPSIGISNDATISSASGTAQNFTNPVEYTVTAADGSTTKYTVTITVEPFGTVITNASPTTLKPGDTITITGTFADNNNNVKMEGSSLYELHIISEDATTIVATLPTAMNESNYYTLSVTSNGVEEIYDDYITVALPAPVINSVTPLTAVPGEIITIVGENFTESGNTISLKGNKNYALTVQTENVTTVTAQLSSNIEEGSYSVEVKSNNKTVTYSSKLEVVDPTKPRIVSLNKTSLMHGLDSLIITGVNLKGSGTNSSFNLWRIGASGAIDMYLRTNADGTEAYIDANVLEDYGVGKYKLTVGDGNKCSTEVEVEIVENTFPVPEITNVVPTIITINGGEFTITGNNFGTSPEVILEKNWYTSYFATVVFATNTSITTKIFSSSGFSTGTWTLSVKANGQTGTYAVPVTLVVE